MIHCYFPVTTGRDDFKVEVKVVCKNDTFSNTFTVYSTHFGFGNNVVNQLIDLKYQLKYWDDTYYSKFVETNANLIDADKDLKSIIEIYTTNDNSKLRY